MKDSNEISRPARARQERRKSSLLVSLLFLATLGGVFGAKLAREANATPGPEGSNELHRRAVQDALAFDGRLDRSAVHVGSDGLVHLELVATGTTLPERALVRRPTDVVVVLDRSGSMGGDPMTKALASIRELLDQLGPEDRFALVTYANDAEVALPLERAAPTARARWNARIGSIAPGGGTNMAEGLDRAHTLLSSMRENGRVARIMLLSDGHANQGDSSADGLARRSARAVAGEYVLSTVGVGEGFDERLMALLADAGTGNFYYVPDLDVLAGIFANEFESARQTVASALEIRIDTPQGVELLDAAGYPIERRSDHALVRPGSLYSGQKRSFWVTLRVPSQEPGQVALGNVLLAYDTLDGRHQEARLAAFPPIEAVVDETQFVERLDADAVQSHHAEDLVNRLRQSVSGLVSSGQYGAARAQLDAVEFDELEALGIDAKDTESFRDVEELKREVERAAAAPAAEQSTIRSQLGKSLYESGTDGRRKGAKLEPSPAP